jgi:hypothetical protein
MRRERQWMIPRAAELQHVPRELQCTHTQTHTHTHTHTHTYIYTYNMICGTLWVTPSKRVQVCKKFSTTKLAKPKLNDSRATKSQRKVGGKTTPAVQPATAELTRFPQAGEVVRRPGSHHGASVRS